MSGAGTSLVAFKQALRDNLTERPALAGVAVLYANTETEIPNEAVWFGKAGTEDLEIPSMRAGKLHLQETYDLDVVVQVMLTEGQSQEDADLRAVEIFAELQQELAAAPQSVDDIQWAKPFAWKHVGGKLGTGHGSRFEIQVRVHARME